MIFKQSSFIFLMASDSLSSSRGIPESSKSISCSASPESPGEEETFWILTTSGISPGGVSCC